MKESREKENKRLHALKDVGLAKTRQYIMGVAYLECTVCYFFSYPIYLKLKLQY